MRYIAGVTAALVLALGWRSYAEPPLSAYGHLPATELVSLSPSGSECALVAAIGDVRQLVVTSRTKGILFTADIGKVKVEGLTWGGDQALVVRLSSTVRLDSGFTTEKAELGGAIAVDLTKGKFTYIFGQGQRQVANTVAGFYGVAELGGRWYGYFGGYPYVGSNQELQATDGVIYADLYKVDLTTGAFELAARGHPDLVDWLVTSSGKIAARSVYNEHAQVWRLLRGSAGSEPIAEGKDALGAPDLLGFGRTYDSLLVNSSAYEPTKVELLAGGEAHGDADLGVGDDALTDPTTGLWIGVSRSGGRDVRFFDPQRQARLRGAFKAFPDVTPRLVSYNAAVDRMIVFTDGGSDSGTYWLVDIASGGADIIGHAYPGVGQADVGPVREIDYKATDGLAMNGILTLPPGRTAKRLPLVVMPHGGPESHDELGFDWWAQAFASRGYAVWQPNFRGSSGFGQAFRDAGFGQWGRRMQTDISDGVAALAARGLVDPARACIVGASYGGYAALAGVTLQKGVYRCAVSFGGVSDPAEMFRSDAARHDGYRNSTVRYWSRYLGVKGERTDDLANISPLRAAAHAEAPVLLIYGRDDTVVLPEQSEHMAKALRAAGKPVDVIVLPKTDHWLLEEAPRVRTLEASVAFVMRNNPPDAAAAVAR